jgi:hypothetical protein
VYGIIKYCPNLVSLEIYESPIDDATLGLIKREMRTGLKRLALLKFEGVWVRRY